MQSRPVSSSLPSPDEIPGLLVFEVLALKVVIVANRIYVITKEMSGYKELVVMERDFLDKPTVKNQRLDWEGVCGST